ncbi:probable ATP-dependent RNA helicase DDX5 [Rhipicephalus sanguineus]|uniref:probable ATP-dependent RNA helicase DDX5 n=1 Tax=Rhipicephalus sanguineus TaxID=34632 RepID=UPI0020C582FA|nr:probable ATP-dependent RNA helicase DDX5 [Rhipicephalus sanguineus]
MVTHIWCRSTGSQESTAACSPAPENQSPASIEKLFHREHFATARRTQAETNEFRKASNVTVRGQAVPTPILGLYEANFSECVTEAAYALNYCTLTALQSQCWPVALHGRDHLTIAHTRAPANEQAYLLPAIVHALHQPVRSTGHGPVVLVLVPTREVAEKIQRLVSDLEKCTDVRIVCLCSGDWKERQLERLKEASYGMWIMTPSHLLSFLEEGKVNISSCTLLVLDEADRMMAMGFEKTLRSISAPVRPDRQTLIFVNSRSREIGDLSECLLNDYLQVSIGHCKLVENQRVEQIVIICEESSEM